MGAQPILTLESLARSDYAESPAVRSQLAIVRSLVDEIARAGAASANYVDGIRDQLTDELARLMRLVHASNV